MMDRPCDRHTHLPQGDRLAERVQPGLWWPVDTGCRGQEPRRRQRRSRRHSRRVPRSSRKARAGVVHPRCRWRTVRRPPIWRRRHRLRLAERAQQGLRICGERDTESVGGGAPRGDPRVPSRDRSQYGLYQGRLSRGASMCPPVTSDHAAHRALRSPVNEGPADLMLRHPARVRAVPVQSPLGNGSSCCGRRTLVPALLQAFAGGRSRKRRRVVARVILIAPPREIAPYF